MYMNVDSFNARLLKYDCLSLQGNSFHIIMHNKENHPLGNYSILYTVLMHSPILATETRSKCLDFKKVNVQARLYEKSSQLGETKWNL